MSEQPKSDRTSVTISKRVHQDFKVRAAELGVTQRSLLERVISNWLRYGDYGFLDKKEEE